ncbi:hypothetical protein [Streptomyces sp. NPDC057718]|uniref:hypothetical protein n=1 Tax=Streptomyces sp. NPDC057718 TaxID=3346225 RepID=UPI0036A505C3
MTRVGSYISGGRSGATEDRNARITSDEADRATELRSPSEAIENRNNPASEANIADSSCGDRPSETIEDRNTKTIGGYAGGWLVAVVL